MAEEGRLRQRACVAWSPGTRLNCCSQLRRPCASWMQASGHGQGCLPDKHREPFEWVAAVTPDSPLFAVALPAPSSPGKAPRKQGQFVCDGQHNKVVRPLVLPSGSRGVAEPQSVLCNMGTARPTWQGAGQLGCTGMCTVLGHHVRCGRAEEIGGLTRRKEGSGPGMPVFQCLKAGLWCRDGLVMGGP